ncbi:MAG: hypothetical protein O9327_02200 [Polaromonas sp.]|nr:hypothetical protein [Polaromonas sp.]
MTLEKRIQLYRWATATLPWGLVATIFLFGVHIAEWRGWIHVPSSAMVLLLLGIAVAVTAGAVFAPLIWNLKVAESVSTCEETGDEFIASLRPNGKRGVEIHIGFNKVGPCAPFEDDEVRNSENGNSFNAATKRAIAALQEVQSLDEIVIGSSHLDDERLRNYICVLVKRRHQGWTTSVDHEFKLTYLNACALPFVGRMECLACAPSCRTAVLLTRKEALKAVKTEPTNWVNRVAGWIATAKAYIFNERRYYRVVIRRTGTHALTTEGRS